MKKHKKKVGKCKFCKKKYKKKKSIQKFCSTKCRNDSYIKRNRKHRNIKIKERGKIGALSELLVCADLLNEGFEVFRSVSQSCSCDLICMKDDKIYRVEVKTARIYGDDEKIYHQMNFNYKKFDLLALVIGKKIIYKYDKKIIEIEDLE